MLTITIPAIDLYDDVKNEFVTSKEQKVCLEHSLVSISKWESKWHKPFLSKGEKTIEETIDYVRCMSITQNVDEKMYDFISNENLNQIREYIEAEMTATTFSKTNRTPNNQVITSEIIYYWMISANIPFECQKWHINRLLTLINVCNINNSPRKKRNNKDLLQRNAAINAARRKSLQSEG